MEIEKKPGHRIAPWFPRALKAKAVLPAALALTLVGAAACSGDDAPEMSPSPSPTASTSVTPVTAMEVCDGVLPEDAARDLERLSGETAFISNGERLLPGDPVGEPEVRLSAFVDEFSPEDFDVDFCEIHSGSSPPAEITHFGFSWQDFGEPSQSETTDPSAIRYRAGQGASLADHTAAIVFSCPAPAGENYVIAATMHTPGITDYPDERMNILNAVSRAVADGLGCLEGSGLPEGRPERVPDGGE
jgi:hypothetical protein